MFIYFRFFFNFFDRNAGLAGEKVEEEWNSLFENYSKSFPKESAELTRQFENKLPENWKENLPVYTPADAGKATRVFSGIVLNKLAETMPEIIGGSADLTPSNNTA